MVLLYSAVARPDAQHALVFVVPVAVGDAGAVSEQGAQGAKCATSSSGVQIGVTVSRVSNRRRRRPPRPRQPSAPPAPPPPAPPWYPAQRKHLARQGPPRGTWKESDKSAKTCCLYLPSSSSASSETATSTDRFRPPGSWTAVGGRPSGCCGDCLPCSCDSDCSCNSGHVPGSPPHGARGPAGHSSACRGDFTTMLLRQTYQYNRPVFRSPPPRSVTKNGEPTERIYLSPQVDRTHTQGRPETAPAGKHQRVRENVFVLHKNVTLRQTKCHGVNTTNCTKSSLRKDDYPVSSSSEQSLLRRKGDPDFVNKKVPGIGRPDIRDRSGKIVQIMPYKTFEGGNHIHRKCLEQGSAWMKEANSGMKSSRDRSVRSATYTTVSSRSRERPPSSTLLKTSLLHKTISKSEEELLRETSKVSKAAVIMRHRALKKGAEPAKSRSKGEDGQLNTKPLARVDSSTQTNEEGVMCDGGGVCASGKSPTSLEHRRFLHMSPKFNALRASSSESTRDHDQCNGVLSTRSSEKLPATPQGKPMHLEVVEIVEEEGRKEQISNGSERSSSPPRQRRSHTIHLGRLRKPSGSFVSAMTREIEQSIAKRCAGSAQGGRPGAWSRGTGKSPKSVSEQTKALQPANKSGTSLPNGHFHHGFSDRSPGNHCQQQAEGDSEFGDSSASPDNEEDGVGSRAVSKDRGPWVDPPLPVVPGRSKSLSPRAQYNRSTDGAAERCKNRVLPLSTSRVRTYDLGRKESEEPAQPPQPPTAPRRFPASQFHPPPLPLPLPNPTAHLRSVMNGINGLNGHGDLNGGSAELLAQNLPKGCWTIGLINSKFRYLTAETFGFKINANGASLKKKQVWTLEPASAAGAGSDACIYLRSHLGKYLAVDSFGNVTCESEEKEPGSKFQISVADDNTGRWAFRNVTRGYYLGASADKLCCTAKAPGDAEFWHAHLAARPQVNLRSVGRKRFAHLSENLDEIHVDANIPWGEDTLFTLEFRADDGGKYALHTCNNKYLSREGKLVDDCGPNCLFSAEYHAGQLALRDRTGAYLSPIGSKAVLKSRSTSVTKDELFSLEDSLPQASFVAALNARYVSVKQGVDVTANQDEISDHETFQLEFDGSTKRWYIRTMQDRYWTLETGGGIQASSDKKSSNALFDLVWQDGGAVAFRANNGKYIATKRSGHLYANCDTVEDNAKYFFYLINRPILVLKCEQGFVGYKSASSPKLECNKATYETIQVERSEKGVVFFKGQNGKYWHVDGESVTCDSDTPEGFFLELREPTRICIKSVGGEYLVANKNGNFRLGDTDYENATKWEY